MTRGRLILRRLPTVARRGAARAAVSVGGQSFGPAGHLRWWGFRRLVHRCGAGGAIEPGIDVIGPGAIEVGDRFRAMRGVMLYASGAGLIVIGDDCSLNANVQIDAGPEDAIRIGDDVLIGTNAVLRNCDHNWRDSGRLIREQGHSCADIEIGDNVWIAANAVVLGGVRLLPGSVVAAGAVVRRGTYGPAVLLAGNPATVLTDVAPRHSPSGASVASRD